MVAGCTAGGPELTTEEAIRIRSACQPGTFLDLTSLVVSDEALAAIPETVTALAAGGSPISDAGVPNLLRLVRLKRLNIGGTHITDEGLASLEGLQNLEWICVNGTPVTSAGVNRFQKHRPDVQVITTPSDAARARSPSVGTSGSEAQISG